MYLIPSLTGWALSKLSAVCSSDADNKKPGAQIYIKKTTLGNQIQVIIFLTQQTRKIKNLRGTPVNPWIIFSNLLLSSLQIQTYEG